MRIGIIGAGHIGGTLARLWDRHEVLLSSRHPEELQDLVDEIGPRACRGTPLEAARWGDVVLLAVPFAAPATFDDEVLEALAGKVVIDAGNPFEERDGEAAREVARSGRGSGRWTAAHLPGARVVKAFNTVHYKRMREGGDIGVALASDHPDALDVASRLISEAGMEPVVVGNLDRAADFDPGTRVWNKGMTASELREAFAAPVG